MRSIFLDVPPPSLLRRFSAAALWCALGFLSLFAGHAELPAAEAAKASPVSPIVRPLVGLEFIDTSFENASPLWYEQAPDGTIVLNLLYDHERASPNRAAGHVHFLIHAKEGTKLTFELRNLDNVWNSVHGWVGREIKTMCLSENGRDWRVIPVDNANQRVRFSVEMTAPQLYVARLEPYRVSDLDRFLGEIRRNPLVSITPIGKTVQGRELEIVRVGRPDAPYRVFLRARAHPWE